MIHTVDADDALCCVPTGQFLFVLLFGQIPHYTIGLITGLSFRFKSSLRWKMAASRYLATVEWNQVRVGTLQATLSFRWHAWEILLTRFLLWRFYWTGHPSHMATFYAKPSGTGTVVPWYTGTSRVTKDHFVLTSLPMKITCFWRSSTCHVFPLLFRKRF